MGGHYYNAGNGEVYPSVTTILQAMLPEPPELKKWKKKTKNWQQVLEYRATVGTLVHYRILNQLSPVTLDFDAPPADTWGDNIEFILDVGEMMFNDFNLDIGYPRTIETLVLNHKYRYAGRVDMLAPINGVQTLGDLKTSREAHLSHKLQMGGYYDAIPTDKKPERAMLFCIHPFAEHNPYYHGHITEIPKDELIGYSKQFIELAKEFHETHTMDGIEANCT